mmetsp:Transcript_47493/g.132418  ORF Transcript_47493/g.132418 Transcript_47493/m.132418 type:complete len:344 (+) Transcript_47493:353-1384(+)
MGTGDSVFDLTAVFNVTATSGSATLLTVTPSFLSIAAPSTICVSTSAAFSLDGSPTVTLTSVPRRRSADDRRLPVSTVTRSSLTPWISATAVLILSAEALEVSSIVYTVLTLNSFATIETSSSSAPVAAATSSKYLASSKEFAEDNVNFTSAVDRATMAPPVGAVVGTDVRLSGGPVGAAVDVAVGAAVGVAVGRQPLAFTNNAPSLHVTTTFPLSAAGQSNITLAASLTGDVTVTEISSVTLTTAGAHWMLVSGFLLQKLCFSAIWPLVHSIWNCPSNPAGQLIRTTAPWFIRPIETRTPSTLMDRASQPFAESCEQPCEATLKPVLPHMTSTIPVYPRGHG